MKATILFIALAVVLIGTIAITAIWYQNQIDLAYEYANTLMEPSGHAETQPSSSNGISVAVQKDGDYWIAWHWAFESKLQHADDVQNIVDMCLYSILAFAFLVVCWKKGVSPIGALTGR